MLHIADLDSTLTPEEKWRSQRYSGNTDINFIKYSVDVFGDHENCRGRQ